MNHALPFIVLAASVFVIGYRYYSAFIAARVLSLDPTRITPAYRLADGNNYVPTSRWVLFGHHFAAITGAGPLIGPVLAAQFGFLPGYLWIVIGVVLGGAVHDFVILTGSVRHNGMSIAQIAKEELGPWAGRITGFAILFIIVIALAGLGVAVVNALENSAWGVFTLGSTIPLALAMGLYMHSGRPNASRHATIVGVAGLIAALIFGRTVADTPYAHYFQLSREALIIAIAGYGFVASVLPVWLLLCPRDYLSSFMKLGTIAALTVAMLVVNPELKLPWITSFASGGGPIIPGRLFPFVFITIACGAISGFHSLVASGTTPKMIENERDCRVIGYGAMLCEAWVGLTSLFAAAALYPADYFAINTPAERFAELKMQVVNLPSLSAEVGETVAGRPGGAVSLAVGMAQIFGHLPGLGKLLAYWYHFAILFEALFILTAIDTGTRVGRFVFQELIAKVRPEWGKPSSTAGGMVATAVIVCGWAGFIWTGSISTIWPLFGVANQLLAAIALVIGSTLIVRLGKRQYVWVTLGPLAFISTTTICAGIESVFENYLPLARHTLSGSLRCIAYLDSALILVMIAALLTLLGIGLRRIFGRRIGSLTPG